MTPEQLKAAREKLGLTQVELAKVLEVGLRTVIGWEGGARSPAAARPIPPAKAKLIEMALRHPKVRLELGIRS
jgi:DNA-binding transcriptional regulator YiaG